MIRYTLKNHPKIEKARQQLEAVKGKTLKAEERAKLATDLAALILLASEYFQTGDEKKQQQNLAKMMEDPIGKVFTTAFADQSFRPHSTSRIAHQMIYLLEYFGIPSCFSPWQHLQLQLFKVLGASLPKLLVPLAIRALRKETSKVILPGEKKKLQEHLRRRRAEKIRLNINHLGEAILGEDEAAHRLDVYLKDLKEDAIDYISIKISTIYSQINLLSWEPTLEHLANNLRKLYRAAIEHPYTASDGNLSPKFVNLDMEEYKDLYLTKDLFKKVLDETEFKHFSAGIVLQAYIPDSHLIQQELTAWAKERVSKGGAPIKIRLVKGANLAMEQVEASTREWEQAPYYSKIETDANYKRMLHYALEPENAASVHIGIGSHNLFDIAYAMLLCVERGVSDFVTFEMLEGMADSIRRIVHELTGKMILYCPVATKEDFQSAIAYLIRRLDENTGHENFLRYMFNLRPHSEIWEAQVSFFLEGFKLLNSTSLGPNRKQNRSLLPPKIPIHTPFENEPDTDFSLAENRVWAQEILKTYEHKRYDPIPLVVNGREIREYLDGQGFDPSKPQEVLYTYALAAITHIEEAVTTAKAFEKTWGSVSVHERCEIMARLAHLLRVHRKHLLGIMIADGGKSLVEADVEYSEAIDFAEYYLRMMLRYENYHDLSFSPKGTVLVTPPWNFPISIPAGGILAGLLTGNCVLFKPAPEAVLCGWELVKLFWEAGVPKQALQFLNCVDNPIG
ncbi:MAG: aldehyde dehydrogenase family protein, partial [Chlamydiae bacterium]|nr:aldehyde dehydrogenase family protein [Chlamydiota bacterium]